MSDDEALADSEALVLRTAQSFVERELRPIAGELDARAEFPRSQLARLAELGLIGVAVPESSGGGGASTALHAALIRTLSSGCASCGVIMAVTSMVAEVISRFGRPDQQHYARDLCSGGLGPGAFALSEPGAGSDPGAIQTRAELAGDHWVLNGQKQWITSGDEAGVLVVWARTGEPGTRGLSAFLVERGDSGLSVLGVEDKLGLRASSTVSLAFDDLRIPANRLLGERDRGFAIAMAALDGGRIGIASQALGIAEAALAESVAYARARRQFDRPIADFQAVQWMLADGDVECAAAHALILAAARAKDRGGRYTREAAIAKLFASEAAWRIADRNVQIHGAAGYVRAHPAERHLRDVRVTRIYEGTSEIQRLVIARSLLER